MGNQKFYEREGIKFNRVTTILQTISKPALMFFYGKYGTKGAKAIADDAKERGHLVHSYIEDFYAPMGSKETYHPGALSTDPQVLNAVRAFHAFDRRYRPRPILQEQTVYYDEPGQEEYRYAGTFDGLFEIGGKVILIDWKTSSALWDDYMLQIEAYKAGIASMVRQKLMKPIKIDGYWAVRFSKGKMEREAKYRKTSGGKEYATVEYSNFETELFDPKAHITRYVPSEANFRGFLALIDTFNTMEAIANQKKEVKNKLKERKSSWRKKK